MTSLETMRRFAPWLLGLFLVAQIAGVVPLLFDHTFHSLEDQRAVSLVHDHAAPGRHGDHRHGVGDVKDECCSLHHLTGVFPIAAIAAPSSFLATRMTAATVGALFTDSSIRIDRPPKTLSLI